MINQNLRGAGSAHASFARASFVTLGLVLSGALLALLLPATPAHAALDGRQADPIVLTGADLPRLSGTDPADLSAYRRENGDWVQIPVQVDERVDADYRALYPFPDKNFVAGGPMVINAYADPGTLVGADTDPLIDGDDEIAMMARDAGERVPDLSGPIPDAASYDGATEVKVTDPVNGDTGYVYLFNEAGQKDQGAGQRYVAYDFDLLSGDYLTTYGFDDGPNPESSSITSGFYETSHSDRWVNDELRLRAGASTGVDILDRDKAQFYPGVCGRSTDSFAGYNSSAAEGSFVINKSGPVRAIRSYIGANSGPYTQREHVYYEQRQDIRTFLRVHAIPQVMQFVDYSPEAAGMTYRNELNPVGVTIDGVPDALAAGLPGGITSGTSTWEQVTGPQGSVDVITNMQSDIEGLGLTNYYLDDSTPSGGAETQCTGDAFAYGASGAWINTALPNTDPRSDTAKAVTANRSFYYGAPGASVDRAEARVTGIDNPLTFAAARLSEPPDEAEIKVKARKKNLKVKAGKKGKFRLVVKNRGNARSKKLKVCLKAPKGRLGVYRKACRKRESLGARNQTEMTFAVKVRSGVKAGRKIKVRFEVTEGGRSVGKATNGRVRVK
ncbi:MAG: hypothetical protein ACERKT_07235 [Acidobacteriota bacterium]